MPKRQSNTSAGSARRKPKKSNRRRKGLPLSTKGYLVSLALLTMFILVSVAGNLSCCSDSETDSPELPTHIAGLDKVTTASGTPEHIKNYLGMNISFNPQAHEPNWVAWELTRKETEGTVDRAKTFLTDESVPGCADPWDYSYSGYDRGHMAPAGDMKWDRQAMKESFYMTNICPQLNSLNSGAWRTLEEKCRVWAQADSAIVIVAGPVLTDELTETIGDSRVVVPKRFFKVVLSPYSNPPRGIGFIMNNGKVAGGMQQAAVSIDEVEKITGHDFFSALPDEVENAVESQCNFNHWSTLRP